MNGRKSIQENDLHFKNELEHGNSSKVYLATIRGKKYAVKTVSPECKNIFDNEVKIFEYLKKFDIPNIATFHQAIGAPHYQIIMEYMPNGDLKDYLLSSNEFNWGQKLSVMRDITTAVGFIHLHGIIHQDIKPENVLLTEGLKAKLCDFGLSTHEVNLKNKHEDLKGTPEYIAPELLEGKKPSTSSDIYSLTVLFWEVASRESAFYDINTASIALDLFLMQQKKLSGEPEPIPEHCPAKVAHLITWGWSVDPAKRPEAATILNKLDGIKLTY